MKPARAVGCAIFLLGNVLAVLLIAYLAVRAGLLPAHCGAEVSPEDCDAIHFNLARPVMPLFWTAVFTTAVADFSLLLWMIVDRRLTERQ